MNKEKYQPSEEEQAKIKKDRTMSDAELLKKGAEYVMDNGVKKPRLELTEKQIEKARKEMDEEIKKKIKEQAFESIKKQAEWMEKTAASGRRPDMKVLLLDGSSIEGTYIGLVGNILTMIKHGVPFEPFKPEDHPELGPDYPDYYYEVLKPDWDHDRKNFIVNIPVEDVRRIYATGMSLMF